MAESWGAGQGAGGAQGDRSDASVGVGPLECAAPEPAISTTTGVDILHFGSTDLVACAGPCIITVSVAITLPTLNALGRSMAQLGLRYPKIASLSVSDRTTGGAIDPACRQELVELARKFTRTLSGSATVFEGSGFRATTLRSLVTAIQMASSASHPAKVFAAPRPALEWLASTQPAGALDVDHLTEAVAALRAQLKQKASEL